MYHCICTELEPLEDEDDTFLLNVRNSLSSDASSRYEQHDLLLCPAFTELGQTCCGVPLVMLCYVMLCYVMLLSYVMLCYVMSCHVMSCHVMSCQVMWCHVMSCDVMSCDVMSCYVMLCYVMSVSTFIFRWVGITAVAKGRFANSYFVAKIDLFWKLRQLHFLHKTNRC